jgi:tetratricopeptide (TPR) repeat protein
VALALAAPASDAVNGEEMMRRTTIVNAIAGAWTVAAVCCATPRAARAQLSQASAVELWHGALTAEAPDAKRWEEAGHALYDAGRYRESIASFERALQLHTARAGEAAWRIAVAYARLGNGKQALRWRAMALDLESPRRVLLPTRGDSAAPDRFRFSFVTGARSANLRAYQ